MLNGVLNRAIAPETASKRTFRADVQGLRAVAVVAVILDHLVQWPRAGFVGVDVFFVISGFLITGLLLREHDRTDTISFIGFYRRRIKRILPASLAVLLATSVAALLLFNESRSSPALGDAIWSLFFSANWRFIAAGTDYFQAQGPVSPLQHFWSLAVEEQFYLVWPWLMLLIFSTIGRIFGKRGARVTVGAALAMLTVASLLWALSETATHPTSAYFSTFSRAWELGVGALLAVGSNVFATVPNRLRPIFAWIGLVTIGTSLFIVPANSGFPAPWAALPVCGTALVIAAGTGGAQHFLYPITNPVSTWIGDQSYSLYVWHFPIIVFVTTVLPSNQRAYGISVAVLVAISTSSYYLLEEPIRRSNLLEARHKRTSPREGRSKPNPRHPRTSLPNSSKARTIGILAVVEAGLLIAAAYQPAPANNYFANPLTSASTAPTTTSGKMIKTQSAAVLSALQATAWPTSLIPSPNKLGSNSFSTEWTKDGCLDVTPAKVASCSYGSGAKTAVLLGDSTAISWMPGLRAALGPEGYRVQSLTLGQCPAAELKVENGTSDAGFPAECLAHVKFAEDWINTHKPDLVIGTTVVNTLSRLVDKASGSDALNEYSNGVTQMVKSLKLPRSHVVLLDAPPGGKNLESCYTAISKPPDCAQAPAQTNLDLAAATTNAAEKTGVRHVSVTSWFCLADGCPSFISNFIVYADGEHLTDTYASKLGPLLRSELISAR